MEDHHDKLLHDNPSIRTPYLVENSLRYFHQRFPSDTVLSKNNYPINLRCIHFLINTLYIVFCAISTRVNQTID